MTDSSQLLTVRSSLNPPYEQEKNIELFHSLLNHTVGHSLSHLRLNLKMCKGKARVPLKCSLRKINIRQFQRKSVKQTVEYIMLLSVVGWLNIRLCHQDQEVLLQVRVV